eukprot:5513745-Amphidinium_carterae.1
MDCVDAVHYGQGADEASLKAFFSSYGQVEDVYVPKRDGVFNCIVHAGTSRIHTHMSARNALPHKQGSI